MWGIISLADAAAVDTKAKKREKRKKKKGEKKSHAKLGMYVWAFVLWNTS